MITKRDITEFKKKIKKWIRQGIGQGRLEEYKPAIEVVGGPTGGQSSIPKGKITGRPHQFLSKLESGYCSLLEFSPSIVDINEQYPLYDLDLLLDIADEMNINYSETGELYLMTSDFLIFEKDEDGEVHKKVRTVKESSKLEKERVLEKFELERRYWAKNGVTDYKIVTEKEINQKIAENCKYLLNQNYELEKYLRDEEILDDELEEIKEVLESRLKKNDKSILECVRETGQEYGFDTGVGMKLFCRLIVERRIMINLEGLINPRKKLKELQDGSNRK